MKKSPLKIISTGCYLPEPVSSEYLAKKTGTDQKYIEKHAGVKQRYFARDGQTATMMGAKALTKALENSHLHMHQIDCIIGASGGIQQPIPCNASLLKAEMKIEENMPAFDINATCLSFVTALDIASTLIESNRYHRIAIVSAEIASVGINWNHKESCFLFGDGAVAVIVEKSTDTTSGVICAHMETYSEGAHATQIRGGGSAQPSYLYAKENHETYLFEMDGRCVFTLTSKHIERFLTELFKGTHFKLEDMKKIIPHQASGLALKAIQRKLKIEDDRFVQIISDYGNMIAASIPLALHLCIEKGDLHRGDPILLLGTSAGMSIGGVVLTY